MDRVLRILHFDGVFGCGRSWVAFGMGYYSYLV